MANYRHLPKLNRLEDMQAIQSNSPLDYLQPKPASELCCSLFDKYRLGLAAPNAPFRLCEWMSVSVGSEQSEGSWGRQRGPYRKYTCGQKRQAVQCIEDGEDVNVVSRRFGIPRRNLLRWRRQGCERKEGGGRPTDEGMERLVFGKIKQGELTDERGVRELAMALSKVDSFKASKGWFIKFCQRYEVKLPGGGCHLITHADIESTDSHHHYN